MLKNIMKCTSYYPNILLLGGFYPAHMGAVFIDIYQKVLDERVQAKKDGNQVVTDTNKIILNSSFGKLSEKHSKLYSPDMLFHITVTGQLTLLMLIEAFEDNDIPVISANTDGIVTYCHESQLELKDALVEQWEYATGFTMEYTHYKSLYFRDVNNYVGFTREGKAKTKGVFTPMDLNHNPTTDIIKTAAINYLRDKTPINRTIKQCSDITQFLQVRTVNGGAVKNGEKLGKAIRWYYSSNEKGQTINYISSGNKVNKSESGKPLMNLSKYLPLDLDYNWYIDEAQALVDLVNTECEVGLNAKVNHLIDLGYSPHYLDHTGKTLAKEGYDFSKPCQLGTQTGAKAQIMQVDGVLYHCDRPDYPSGWTAFTKKTEVTIIYGGMVALPSEVRELPALPKWVESMIYDYATKVQRLKMDAFASGLLS